MALTRALTMAQSALVATTISGSFAWKNVENGPTAVSACWYSSLLLAVVAITSASQQNNTLRKMTCHKDGSARLRQILRSEQLDASNRYRESYLQHFVWQTPIMLQNVSIIIYLIGFVYLIFHGALERAGVVGARESRVSHV